MNDNVLSGEPFQIAGVGEAAVAQTPADPAAPVEGEAPAELPFDLAISRVLSTPYLEDQTR